MRLRNNIGIITIILAFICANAIFLNSYKDVWWDSSVYIGMGKYMYSVGQSGLWENSRPIVWPLILGFLWKIGLNVILIGRFIEILFGGLCILFTYKIGRKLFNERTAFLSSLFLALSPTFFFFDGIMLTEIVSTFFSLVAIYLFIEKKYTTSGLLLGMSFLTRFLQLFAFIGVLLVVLLHSNKKNMTNLKKILMGFVIPVIPYLILNFILYNGAFLPPLQQIFLSNNSGWSNYHSTSYYFIELFKENFLYLSSILGLMLISKKDPNKTLIATIFLVFFIFFNLIRQKEMRFLIVLLPYMYLLMSFSLLYFLNYLKNKTAKSLFIALIIVSFVFSFKMTYIYHKNELNKNNPYAAFQGKLKEISPNSRIWVSNPMITVFSDIKADKLMYYPVFNKDKKDELVKDFKSADFIFVDSCDLACKPFDVKCESDKNDLLAFFKQQLITTYSSIVNECQQYIFQK